MSQNFYRPEGPAIEQVAQIVRQAMHRPLVLVGLMGSGKSRLGRLIAKNLDLPFYDADAEIELSAGRTVREVLAEIGESAFRSVEVRVLQRLMNQGISVIATGGGTHLTSESMQDVLQRAHVLWVRANFDVMLARLTRGTNPRPLLDGKNIPETLRQLMDDLYPIYTQAHAVIDSCEGPAGDTLQAALMALAANLDKSIAVG